MTPPGLRKFVLAAHLTVSVGWIGAAIAYLALGGSAVTSQDTQTVRAAWITMELTGCYVIVPLALAALFTGVVISLGTPWGLFRLYRVLISLVLTILSTVVPVLHVPDVSYLANVAREAEGAELAGLEGDLLHPGLGPRGVARDHGAERVQAAGRDAVWVAQTVRTAYA